MPYSHHSHSGQFCKHASGSLEQVVLQAIDQGFEVYGITEHVPRYRKVDLYPEEEGITLEDLAGQFHHFIEEAHRLKEDHANRITLLVGLETEFITGNDLQALSQTLSQFGERIEYVVGSVHHVNEIPIDFDRETFNRCLASVSSAALDESQVMERLLVSYLDSQYEILRRFYPEIVGHVDLCRLYNPWLRFADYPAAHDRLERNIKFAVGYGALFEANAAAFRKGWDTAYPGEDVLQLILKHGGRFALSDDSHGPHAVGLGYYRLAEYLRRAGVQELWYLERCKDLNAGGRKVRPVRMQGDWGEHAFWSSLDR